MSGWTPSTSKASTKMPKPKSAIPTEEIHLRIPLDVYAALQSFLFSPAEGRVPLGAYQSFFSARIREFFSLRQLDLAPFVGGPPGAFFVSGTPEALEQLRNAFKEKI